ncbi:hydrolase [Marmoricola endophyticus]|uniref:Hydrolase n=1 Tax=Marmoricola endophyticus TaxID=2040280 RepID=A0A917BSH8_9ACTN|nr:alpha/beta hydrolase [Marmoricola endophyticus]GGF57122.1 hydrolase [Marmoricola endophyticus]
MTDVSVAPNQNVHVEDTGGAGRPVVLIHGWPLSGQAWTDQVAALTAEGFRVITYDRRGFGDSDAGGPYDYDTLAADLHTVLTDLDLTDVTLVGFSMGGGEVARYVGNHGEDRLHSVVFASAVPPYLLQSDDNPDGPLTQDAAGDMRGGLEASREEFFPGFCEGFFTAGEELKATDQQVQDAVALCHRSDQDAALGCMDAFGTTDFRGDLPKITVPTLVLHGDSDGIVPFEGSGQRTAAAIASSETHVIAGAPHGCNTTHAEEFNAALLAFCAK